MKLNGVRIGCDIVLIYARVYKMILFNKGKFGYVNSQFIFIINSNCRLMRFQYYRVNQYCFYKLNTQISAIFGDHNWYTPETPRSASERRTII